MASKLFISAKEVAKELEVSDSYAYRLIRQLNAELEQKGFVILIFLWIIFMYNRLFPRC